MAHLKYYFAVQVILLFNLHLLSAEGEGLQDNPVKPHITPSHHITPHIESGPGQIVGISKKIKVRDDESKDINNLLYAIYKKFHKDVQRRDSDNENVQQKKQVAADASADLSKVKVEKKSEDINLDSLKEDVSAKKKEDHKIALRELENTIDKLIVKLSKDSNNDNIETNEIKKGIKEISKFADLSDINVSDRSDHATAKIDDDDDVDDFENFKDAFYKTFADKQKKQQIVYHGKDAEKITTQGKEASHAKKQYHDENNNAKLASEEIKKGTITEGDGENDFENFKDAFYKAFINKEKKQNIVYHGKDAKKIMSQDLVYHGKDAKKIMSQGKEDSVKKQYHDEINNARTSKWLTSEEIKKFADLYGISISVKDDAHAGDKKAGGIDSFKDFKDKFYKTFLNEDITNKDQNLVYHGKDNNEGNVAKQLLKHGKDNIIAKEDDDSQNKDHEKEITAKKDTNDVSDAQLKDLVHLYEELKKQTATEEEKKNAKRTNNEDKRSMRIETLKKNLMALLDQQDTANYAEEKKLNPVNRKREISKEDETQIKGRLLSMVRSLEAKLTGESEKDTSYKGNDRIENELNNLASKNIKTKKKENNRFLEALKGFELKPQR